MNRREANFFTSEDFIKALNKSKLQRKTNIINVNAGLLSASANILMFIGHLFKTHANELSDELERDRLNDIRGYEKVLEQMITLNNELKFLQNYLEWVLKFLSNLQINIPLPENEKSTQTQLTLNRTYAEDEPGFLEDQIISVGDNCKLTASMILTIANILKAASKSFFYDENVRRLEGRKGRVYIDKEGNPKVFQITSRKHKI